MISIRDYFKYPDLMVFTPGCGISLADRVPLSAAMRIDAKELDWETYHREQMMALKRELAYEYENSRAKRVKVKS